MAAPEKITIDHQHGKTSFSGWGSCDMSKPFRQDYVRADLADRSQATHNHEFAVIRDLWQNLPESCADISYCKNADLLRKHALIKTGYFNLDLLDFGTADNAQKMGPEVARIARRDHGYALVMAKGSVVQCVTPHSQSNAAMGAKAFQESKQAVIDWIEGFIEEIHDMRQSA